MTGRSGITPDDVCTPSYHFSSTLSMTMVMVVLGGQSTGHGSSTTGRKFKVMILISFNVQKCCGGTRVGYVLYLYLRLCVCEGVFFFVAAAIVA